MNALKYSGNGSLMRIAPITIYYMNQPELAWQYAELSSKTTHVSSECIQSCQYFTHLLIQALQEIKNQPH